MKTYNNSGCRCGCGVAGAVLGVIFGIIVASLFAAGLTPLIINAIWIALGIGGAALIYILILSVISSCDNLCCNLEKCLRSNIKCLLAGSLGTILSALVLSAIALEIASTAVVILVAIGTFFLIFLIASLVSFVKCLVSR